MTIVINVGLHTGCIGGIFITGIFGNFYTKRGEFLTFKTGIPGGLDGNLKATLYHNNVNSKSRPRTMLFKVLLEW